MKQVQFLTINKLLPYFSRVQKVKDACQKPPPYSSGCNFRTGVFLMKMINQYFMTQQGDTARQYKNTASTTELGTSACYYS